MHVLKICDHSFTIALSMLYSTKILLSTVSTISPYTEDFKSVADNLTPLKTLSKLSHHMLTYTLSD